MNQVLAIASNAAVHLKGVRKTFGSVVAVDHVDLEMSRGEVAALLGPNGAGKSTTVDLLLGLTSPDRGSTTVLGLEPHKAVEQGLVGAMLQSGGMPPDVRVGDLVRVVSALHVHPLPAEEALERAGAVELKGRRVPQLSGGQLQRLRLALALLPDPQLLVLDEPTSAMDVASRRSFWSDLTDWGADGRSLLFTTHHLEEADAYADRVVHRTQLPVGGDHEDGHADSGGSRPSSRAARLALASRRTCAL